MRFSTERFDSNNDFFSSVRPEDDGDLRGYEIYDRDDKQVGLISEIYCCKNDLTAKYAEIISFDRSKARTFLYPFDAIVWSGNGIGFLGSTFLALSKHKEYDADFVLAQEGGQLITYNEAVDLGLEPYGYDCEDLEACA